MKQVKIKIIDTQSDQVTDIDNYNVSVLEDSFKEEYAAPGSIILSFEGGDTKYVNLMASSLDFSLLVSDGSDGAFYNLFTGSETRFRVELYNDEDLLLWQGFLIPDQYTEPYASKVFFVNMTATDGIGLLKGKTLGGISDYSARHSVISYISKCLSLTGLKQDIYFSPAIESAFKVPWHEIYIDGELYREEPKKSDVLVFQGDKRDNAYDILERLIHDLGCRLFTYEGKWFIIGYNQLQKNEWECYKYSSSGDYLDQETVYQYTSNAKFYDSANISVLSPFQYVEVTAEYDSDDLLIDEFFYASEAGDSHIIPNDYKQHWKIVGNITLGPEPKDGKWIYTWTHPGQLLPDIKPSDPLRMGVGPWQTEANVKSNYIELAKPIWVEKSGNFDLKYVSFSIEMIGYSLASTKDNFENNKYSDLFRYELIHNGKIVLSNFPDSSKYADSAFELRYSDDSIEWKEEVYYNKNFVETRRRVEGKFSKEKIYLTERGYLQLRIYPPVLTSSTAHFNAVAIQNLELKILERDDYYIRLSRDVDFSTNAEINLFHIDNAQDNTKKRFLFSQEGLDDVNKRLAWNRVGESEIRRYGDCYARLYHSLQPEPIIRVEGDLVGVYSPLSRFDFKWVANKEFVLTRLNINYTEARTSVTMVESKIENVM